MVIKQVYKNTSAVDIITDLKNVHIKKHEWSFLHIASTVLLNHKVNLVLTDASKKINYMRIYQHLNRLLLVLIENAFSLLSISFKGGI